MAPKKKKTKRKRSGFAPNHSWDGQVLTMRFRVYEPVERSKMISLRLPDKQEAIATSQRTYREFKDGVFDPWRPLAPSMPSDMSIQDAVKAYEAYHQTKTRPDGVRRAQDILRQFAKDFGPDTLLRDLESPGLKTKLSAYRAWMGAVRPEHLRPSTQRSYANDLYAFLNWASDSGLLSQNLAIVRNATPKGGRIHITEDHLKQIIAYGLRKKPRPAHPTLLAMIQLRFYTALRAKEALSIRAKDIDTRRWVIQIGHDPEHFVTKTGHSRPVMVPRQARAILWGLLEGKDPDELIFEVKSTRLRKGQKHLQPYQPEWWSRNWKTLCTDALGKDYPYRCLRASCAYWMLRGGMHLDNVTRQLGHRSTEVTLRHYADFFDTVPGGYGDDADGFFAPLTANLPQTTTTQTKKGL